MNKLMKLGISLIIIFCVGLGVFTILNNTVDINEYKEGKAVFKYEDKDIEKILEEEDFNYIKSIFNGKYLTSGIPSCGVSKDVAIIIEDQIFSIGCDGCGVIYWVNKDKYFYLTEEENKKFKEILIAKYEFIFPCI